MGSPLGEEHILIRPDAAGFRAELQAQIAAALTGVGPQIAAAQSRLTRTAAGSSTLGGLPAATNAAVLAQTKLGSATKATEGQLAVLSGRSNSAAAATRHMHREIESAETAAGRYTRGLFAASAASTGLFRAVSFASGAFLLGAIAGGAAAAGVRKFADETRLAAQTAALLKSGGDAANISAEGVDRLANAEQRLTGISNDQVKAASNILLTFHSLTNQAGNMNNIFDRSVKAVVDISSVFKTDLRGSAVQLGKALQDPVKGVTALRRSGITLSQSQRELIKRLVETGRILTAQKVILGEVDKQVGGTARAIGETLPGKLDILKARARDALGEYVKRVSESRQASLLAAQAGQGLSQAFTALKDVVRAIGPPLLVVVEGLAKATQAIGGVGPLLAAAAAYKAVTIAVSLAAAAQRLYARAALIGAGATSVETRALASSTVALRLQTTALAVNTLGAGAAEAGVGLRASRIGSAALGGKIGIAAIAVAGLTFGLIKLREAGLNAPGGLRATSRALDALSDSVIRLNKLRTDLAGKQENVSIGRFDVQAATNALAKAEAAGAASGAAPGSLERLHLDNQITIAEQKLADANKDLALAERARDIALEQANANERARPGLIAKTTRAFNEQIAALRKLSLTPTLRTIQELGGRTPATGLPPARVLQQQQAESAATALRKSLDILNKMSESGDQVKRNVGGALATIETVLNRVVRPREIKIAVRLAGEGKSVNDIVRQLLGIGISPEQIRLRGLAATPSPSATQEQQFLAAKALLKTEHDRLKTLRDAAATRKQELATQVQAVAAAKEAVAAAREGLAAAIDGLHSAQQALADTIRSSRQAVNQAVTDAKSNLDTLGQAVADALAKFADAGGKTLGSAKLGKNFEALKAQILAGGGGPETQRAAAQISFRLSASSNIDTSKITQGFADLTDKLNRGKITLPQFNRQLAALLKGFDLGAFRKQFGSAAANLLRDEIATLRKQARLILTGPQRPGGGIAQTLVRPLQAVAQGAHDIAAAQKDVVKARSDVVKADHDLASAIRDLHSAQVKETRANTAATKANSRVVQQLVDVLKAQQKLEGPKRKPKGDAGKTAGDLTNAGAGAP